MGNTASQHTGHSGTNKTLTVDVLQNENAKNQVDVVLCFVDTKWGSRDRLSQAMSSLAGNIYVTERDTLMEQHPVTSPGDVFTCNGGKLNCKSILLVVVPEGDLSEHLLEVRAILLCAFQKATELGAHSITIPLGIEPPFQVNIILPVLYTIYLDHDTESSSLNLFHLVTIDQNIQLQILQTIKEMNESIPDSVSNSEGEEEPSYRNNGNAMLNNNTSHHPPYGETASQERHVHVDQSSFDNLSDSQDSSAKLNHLEEHTPVQKKKENDVPLSNGNVLENHQYFSEDDQISNPILTNQEASAAGCVTALKPLVPVHQLQKEVAKISENDFLKSVNMKTSDSSNTRSVKFSDEVEEYVDPERPPLVRSLSSDSDDAGGRLDFQNFSVKRPVTRPQGKRPVQRGEPVVVAKYDEELAAKKADPVFFCVICQMEHRKDLVCAKTLDKCKHVFCEKCIEGYFAKEKPVCPICNMVYGAVHGTMPPGIMSYWTREGTLLPGHRNEGVIVIEYDIPDGIQTEEHPHPGKPFKGASRTAYIPNSEKGQKCLRLLQKAFDRKLTFTVGRSRTTGRDDCVTWNDIHHKTNINGGPQRFGYPDPGYLDRLETELKERGVTED